MTSERPEVPAASVPEASPAFAVLGTDFVEVLALFVRTIPLYPDGHGRVVAVSDRLEDTAGALSEPVVIEVAERGFVVNGKARPDLPPGPKALRDALLATAVVRVTFQPTTSASSYVAFARSLQRNARLAQHSHLRFADLWMAPIPGIEIEELIFGTEGFADHGDDVPRPADSIEVLGSGPDGRGAAVVERADAPEVGTRPPAIVPPVPRVRHVRTVSRDLRARATDDGELGAAIATIRSRLVSASASASTGGLDLLEHLVRALPIEARLDPEKGLRVLRSVVERLVARLPDAGAPGATDDLPARFADLLGRVFPHRVAPVEDAGEAADVTEVVAMETLRFDELQFLDGSVLDGLCAASDEGPAPVPELAGDDGIVDLTGVVLHALLEESAGERRTELRRRLLEGYAARPKGAPPPCLLRHLAEAIAAPTQARDLGRVALLTSILDETTFESRPGASPITLDVAVALFPVGLAAYLRGGGRAGAVARRIGREAVLAAADRLVAAHGALAGASLDRVLAERSHDVLPFVEALLVAAPSLRSRAVRVLRALDLKSLAAVALRVVPDGRFSDAFLRALCAEAYEGVDSTHLVPEAASALGNVAVDQNHEFDVQTRSYATAALGSFPVGLASPPLRTLAARKLFGSAPKELRHAAEEILERFQRDAALARPVP